MSEKEIIPDHDILMGLSKRVARLEIYHGPEPPNAWYVLGWAVVALIFIVLIILALSIIAVAAHWAAHTWGLV